MLESTTISDEIYDLIENRIDRCMFVLFYNWGLTPKEIGHCFDLPEHIVLKHLQSARETIKKVLDE
jgi:DNA-directed RNA polymerase specialized sigma24 family protein